MMKKQLSWRCRNYVKAGKMCAEKWYSLYNYKRQLTESSTELGAKRKWHLTR